jgi:hypothetical protein
MDLRDPRTGRPGDLRLKGTEESPLTSLPANDSPPSRCWPFRPGTPTRNYCPNLSFPISVCPHSRLAFFHLGILE